MGSFIVWDMSSKANGIWKTVEAANARAAAEQICGVRLRSAGSEDEICVRVRSLDDAEQPLSLFYGEKTGAAARDTKKRQAEQKKVEAVLDAAE